MENFVSYIKLKDVLWKSLFNNDEMYSIVAKFYRSVFYWNISLTYLYLISIYIIFSVIRTVKKCLKSELCFSDSLDKKIGELNLEAIQLSSWQWKRLDLSRLGKIFDIICCVPNHSTQYVPFLKD